VDRWHVPSIDATGKREPRVLFSRPECRAVVIDLQTGETMGEHQVHENAIIHVASGRLRVTSGGSDAECPAGTLVHLGPRERHAVYALETSRILILLAPWPGEGHYQQGEQQHLAAHAQVHPLE
jgi:quercetin dioxygenase-like cupin family protein